METESEIAQKGPYELDLIEGKRYHWCSCGRSLRQPHCDGSHMGTGLRPLNFTAAETGKAFLCGCKRTGTPPFCDDTHNNL
jgi:CDGSH-type Zn-finger protein